VILQRCKTFPAGEEWEIILIVLYIASEVQEDLEREMASEDHNMPLVKHYEQRDYNGMFDYNKEDEMLLIKSIIVGKP
jgi:hypothetical protein